MQSINTQDRVYEFRITIDGRLSDDAVLQVADLWAAALSEALPRRIMVDISKLAGYDGAGRKLFRDMHLHGTEFAASTPQSLIFLAEITSPRRRGVTIIPQSVAEPMQPSREERQPLIVRAVAN